MSVATTSKIAYRSLRNEGTQAQRIFEYVSDKGSATIAMIARALRMEKSTVSARVNSLVHGKERKLEFSHIDKCPVTSMRTKWWRPIEYTTSEDLQVLMNFDSDGTNVNVID